MRARNIVSVLEGEAAVYDAGIDMDERFRLFKTHEIRSMKSFVKDMYSNGCEVGNFDGFFVSYKIPQISKEMDLLRFGQDYVLNIEIKSNLMQPDKKEYKILKQMRENYYYLAFLNKPLQIFTYVEDDGFYMYNVEKDTIERTNSKTIAECMITQCIDYSIDPDEEFVPSNYLISPFNSTDAFISGKYFLTSAQNTIKTDFYKELDANPLFFCCISANAGTGKTLLMYDIAKESMNQGKKILVIHCGILNSGHYKLIENYNWNIIPIKDIPYSKNELQLNEYDCVFVDEAQRIRIRQLTALTEKAVEQRVPIVFSFDTKQYLREGEATDIYNFLKNQYPTVAILSKTLTDTIRTNKNMSSFITNMLNTRKTADYLNYGCVTIEYMNNLEDLESYIGFLENKGWTPITYTSAQHGPDPYHRLSNICINNAHAVIGQEFSKVVFAMDDNFAYNKDGKLMARESYYSAQGMLYQIVTRVIGDMKIIVFKNPELYVKLLEIKAMGM